MSEGVRNIDGTNIAYARRGQGTPLILLHGYPLDRTIWQGAAELLANDFDVIMPDLRGFGQSDVMEADRSMLAYASDLAGLLERLGIRKAHVAGHSMGGYVALAFARMFPRKIAGIGLVSSQELADTEERKAARHATAQRIMQDGIDGVVQEMPPKLSANVEVQEFVRSVIANQRPMGLAVALDAMAERPDSADVLRSFPGPAVIIHGSSDELISVERAREMRVLLPSAHYLELPGVGHMPMMENPAAVAEALRFLGAIRRGAVTILDD
jgi:3-oxoadipate enol-lactonase